MRLACIRIHTVITVVVISVLLCSLAGISQGKLAHNPAILPHGTLDQEVIRRVIPKVVVVYNEHYGAGVLVSSTGDILTNEHVVGDNPFVRVRFSNGVETRGEVVAKDERSDLALIRVSVSDPLPFLKIGDDGALEQGDTVFHCGHPFGEEFVCTKGIVSKRWTISPNLGSEFYGEWISDAPVFPGFSGGASVNIHGELVGLPHARAPGRIMPAGISILIPPDILNKAYRDFTQHGEFRWAHLGIQVQDMPQSVANRHGMAPFQGVLVNKILSVVSDDSFLKPKDILTHVENHRVKHIDALRRVVRVSDPKETLDVRVLRGGKVVSFSIALREGVLAEGQHVPKDVDVTEVFGGSFYFDETLNRCIVDAVEEQGSAMNAGIRSGTMIVWYRSRNPLNSGRQVEIFRNELRLLEDGEGMLLRVSNDEGKTFFSTMLFNPIRRMWL